MRIDGVAIANTIFERLRRIPTPKKRLVAVLIAASAASISFVARKAAMARSLGIGFETVSFSGVEPEADIADAIRSFSSDSSVGGIVLQLPLPHAYNRDALIRAIAPLKDVDNLSGCALVMSPAVSAVLEVLSSCGTKITNYKAVRIVGNGFLVGAPIARFCVENGIPYMVADSTTRDLVSFIGDADLVITGVGHADLIDPLHIREGAGVIDFGFPPDFNQEKLRAAGGRLTFYTPTPFGTGPILIAKLFENFYTLHRG